MRRRRRIDRSGPPPPELLVYDPADWPATACHPQCAYWAAVRQWQADHPGQTLPREHRGPLAPFHPELI